MKVGVLMGGPSEERDVSLTSGKAVLDACKKLGYDATAFKFKNNYKGLKNALKTKNIIFNALHGGIGENGKIQEWLYSNGIRYTGSDAISSALCMKKANTKSIVRSLGIKTPDWELLENIKDKPTLDFPFVVKPNNQGSTVGLNIVFNDSKIHSAIKEAFKYSNQIMVEKYIDGRELTVPILGSKAYPIVEIEPSNAFYDYDCKYTPGMSKYICPAELDLQLTNAIQRDTELVFNELGCGVYGRADYLIDSSGDHYFLEMNTLPGMTSTSLFPKSVNVGGLSFENLIEKIIELSL